MKLFRKLTLYFSIIILIIFSCEKIGKPPESNNPPETFILSYEISPIAELDSLGNPTLFHKTTVYWNGSDIDGQIKSFLFSTDSLVFDKTTQSQHDFFFNYSSPSTMYKIWVKAVDDLGAEDTTPALSKIQLNLNIEIETTILDGPPNGAEVSSAVRFKINATSNFGKIKYISYKVDDGIWTNKEVDLFGTTTIDFTGMSTGVRTIYFAGKIFENQQDGTPAVTTVIVREGFSPIIINKSPTGPGGGWYAGYPLRFAWSTSVEHYYGILPLQPYSFAFDDSTNFNKNSNFPLASGWNSNTSSEYVPNTGHHNFYLKVRDNSGGIALFEIDFDAAPPFGLEGILVVCGVQASVRGSLIIDKINTGAYWGSLIVDFWDIFGDMNNPQPEFTLPSNAVYVGGGSGIMDPANMAPYSTIVWLGDNKNEDLEIWINSPIIEYLNAGGNIILASRMAEYFLSEELENYLNIDYHPIFSVDPPLFILNEYKSLIPEMIDMGPPFDLIMDSTSLFSTTGFNEGNNIINSDISNWTGNTGFSKDHFTTLLFAHRDSSYNSIYTVPIVSLLGIWSHPNFMLNDLTSTIQFPVFSPFGNFILINGRHYGFDTQTCHQNFEFILRNMCGGN
jgi:hypothetical protein